MKMFLSDKEWLKKEGRTDFPPDYGLRRSTEVMEIIGWSVIIICSIVITLLNL